MQIHPCLFSALDGGELSALRPRRIIPCETVSETHWTWSYVVSTAGLDVSEEIKSHNKYLTNSIVDSPSSGNNS
jgi:hypothetical protein